MHRFFDLVHTIWKIGRQGDPSIGFQFDYQFVRWEEMGYRQYPLCKLFLNIIRSAVIYTTMDL